MNGVLMKFIRPLSHIVTILVFNTNNEDRPLSESWLEVRTCLSIAPSKKNMKKIFVSLKSKIDALLIGS